MGGENRAKEVRRVRGANEEIKEGWVVARSRHYKLRMKHEECKMSGTKHRGEDSQLRAIQYVLSLTSLR